MRELGRLGPLGRRRRGLLVYDKASRGYRPEAPEAPPPGSLDTVETALQRISEADERGPVDKSGTEDGPGWVDPRPELRAWQGALEAVMARAEELARHVELGWFRTWFETVDEQTGEVTRHESRRFGHPWTAVQDPEGEDAADVFRLEQVVGDRPYELAASLIRHRVGRLLAGSRGCATVPLAVHPPSKPQEAERFWNFCRSRGCPRCTRIRRGQLADRMAEAVLWSLKYGRLRGLTHVTLTHKANPGETYREAVARLSAALVKLYRSPAWKMEAAAWFTNIEAVLGESPVAELGGELRPHWHVHAHIMVNARGIDFRALRDAWWKATGARSNVFITRKLSGEDTYRARLAMMRGEDDPKVQAKVLNRETGELEDKRVPVSYLVREAVKYPLSMAELELERGASEGYRPEVLAMLAEWVVTGSGIRHFRPGGHCTCRRHALAYATVRQADGAGRESPRASCSGNHDSHAKPAGAGPLYPEPEYIRLARGVRTGRRERAGAFIAAELGKRMSRWSRSCPEVAALGKLMAALPAILEAAAKVQAGEVCDPRACWRHVFDDLLDPPGVLVPAGGDIAEVARRALGGSVYYAQVLQGLARWVTILERGPP